MTTRAQTQAMISAAMAEVDVKLADNSHEAISAQDMRDVMHSVHNILTILSVEVQNWVDGP